MSTLSSILLFKLPTEFFVKEGPETGLRMHTNDRKIVLFCSKHSLDSDEKEKESGHSIGNAV